MSIPADIELDLSGLSCPMPLLKAKLALNAMEKEQILKIIATDSASERDFHMFARRAELVSFVYVHLCSFAFVPMCRICFHVFSCVSIRSIQGLGASEPPG